MAQRRSASFGIAIVLIIIAIAVGAYWFMMRGDKPQEANTMINPQTASQLSEGFRGISEQDTTYASTTQVKLVPDQSAEPTYAVIRPFATLSTADQAKSKQTLTNGTVTTTQTYALAKRSGNGDDARSLYNSGYFVYTLAGAITKQGTEAVVKSKAQAEIQAYEKGNSDPDSPYTYANGTVEKGKDITIMTTKGEKITLPVSKYKQTVASKNNPAQKKDIVRVLAAAKLGTQLVLVNMVVDDSNEFGNESALLQAMAAHVKLEVI